jgi:hypothetical protein
MNKTGLRLTAGREETPIIRSTRRERRCEMAHGNAGNSSEDMIAWRCGMEDQLPRDSDGDALRRLIATGSDLSKEMEIDFAVDIPDRDTGLAFAAAVARMGYRTSVYQDGSAGEWSCYCSRVMIPSYDAIVAVQETLERIGRPFHAKPDGWGSFGNATENGREKGRDRDQKRGN